MARYGDNHRGGRPKGTYLTPRTVKVRDVCRDICEDPEYAADLLVRARTRQLGAMEPVIWAYAYGKPKERVDIQVGVQEDLSQFSAGELAQRLATMAAQLDEV